MTTRLEKAAAAWRALPAIRRGEVLRGLSCALAGGWREVWDLALAAEEEPGHPPETRQGAGEDEAGAEDARPQGGAHVSLIVYYHANCIDGAMAAGIVLRKHPDATCIPVRYDEPPPGCEVNGADVMVVDFSWPRDVLMRMREDSASLVVYDHHKTARDALAGLDFCVFDMERSGAGLTWDELQRTRDLRPAIVDYVEDRDLWRWALPDSREVSAGLRLYDITPEWCVEALNSDDPGAMIDRLIAEGDVVLRRDAIVVEHHARNAKPTVLPDGTPAMAVNATTLASEIGNAIATKHGGVAACWTDYGDGRVKWELRSLRGGPDVGEIAKRCGGGGHANASGFTTKAVRM